jgi:hypothetical protein
MAFQDEEELYRIDEDPGEERNLIGEKGDETARLKAALINELEPLTENKEIFGKYRS